MIFQEAAQHACCCGYTDHFVTYFCVLRVTLCIPMVMFVFLSFPLHVLRSHLFLASFVLFQPVLAPHTRSWSKLRCINTNTQQPPTRSTLTRCRHLGCTLGCTREWHQLAQRASRAKVSAVARTHSLSRSDYVSSDYITLCQIGTHQTTSDGPRKGLRACSRDHASRFLNCGSVDRGCAQSQHFADTLRCHTRVEHTLFRTVESACRSQESRTAAVNYQRNNR